jgi:CubicO group peptidase (beta-lactamase class C family)
MKPSAADQLRTLIDSPAFSGVISIIHRGEVLLEQARGLANRESGEMNRMDTRFATASVSKMFTATCIARLVDAGLCRFDTPVVDVAPYLRPRFNERMTLASLMSHGSGLGDYINDDAVMPFDGMDTARLECPQDFLPYVIRNAGMNVPGAYQYSSAGYILLGLAIEALTGLRFIEAMRQWVIEPAGMAATGFPPLDAPAAGLATGYLPDGRANFHHLPRLGGPDGGIVTNVADLHRFFACLRGESLISPESRGFLLRQEFWLEPAGGYSHGFMITPIGGQPWYGHTGSDPGVSARVAFAMEGESSIIVLCNVEEQAFNAFKLARQWLAG